MQQELTELLGKYYLRPDKKLGQHYLIDQVILDAIIAASDVKDNELIVEVGGGPGVLTKALAKAGAEVLTVEFDRDFCRLLGEEFHNWRNVHVLCDDALRLDFSNLKKDDRPYAKMVANIPYQITNPLIRKILEPGSVIDTAVLLIQKEVADRLMAAPSSADRGILTVYVEYYGLIEKVIDVPPAAFWPSPKVDSTVIKLTKEKDPEKRLLVPDQEQGFFWFVKQGFSGKRKKLPNSLSGGLDLSKSRTVAIVEGAGISVDVRAEDLSVEEWVRLFNSYSYHVLRRP